MSSSGDVHTPNTIVLRQDFDNVSVTRHLFTLLFDQYARTSHRALSPAATKTTTTITPTAAVASGIHRSIRTVSTAASLTAHWEAKCTLSGQSRTSGLIKSILIDPINLLLVSHLFIRPRPRRRYSDLFLLARRVEWSDAVELGLSHWDATQASRVERIFGAWELKTPMTTSAPTLRVKELWEQEDVVVSNRGRCVTGTGFHKDY